MDIFECQWRFIWQGRIIKRYRLSLQINLPQRDIRGQILPLRGKIIKIKLAHIKGGLQPQSGILQTPTPVILRELHLQPFDNQFFRLPAI